VLFAVLPAVAPFALYFTVYVFALNIAYTVILLFDIVSVSNFVVAALFVFHPTNVYPVFVAVTVKSTGFP